MVRSTTKRGDRKMATKRINGVPVSNPRLIAYLEAVEMERENPERKGFAAAALAKLKGKEVGQAHDLVNRIFRQVADQVEEQRTETTEAHNPNHPEGEETKAMAKEKAPKVKAEKAPKVKKEKPKKEPIQYEFETSVRSGSRVFTPHGVAVIKKEDRKHKVYQITVDESGETKVISMKAARDKAFDEKFRDRYEQDKSRRTASGGYSVSNGDEIAKALNALTVEQLERVARTAGLSDRFERWEHVNPGMKRMNLGNVLRAAVEKDETKAKANLAIQEAAKMPRQEPEKKATKPKAEKKAPKTKGSKKAKAKEATDQEAA
jgi:hypothetical protein